MQWLTKRRKEYTAKTLLDLAKVSMSVLVINQFITKEPLRILVMMIGVLISVILFLMALTIDNTET